MLYIFNGFFRDVYEEVKKFLETFFVTSRCFWRHSHRCYDMFGDIVGDFRTFL